MLLRIAAIRASFSGYPENSGKSITILYAIPTSQFQQCFQQCPNARPTK